jgi:hypothetical protein
VTTITLRRLTDYNAPLMPTVNSNFSKPDNIWNARLQGTDVIILSTNQEMVVARKKMRVLDERLVVIEKFTMRNLAVGTNELRRGLDIVREERDEVRELVGHISMLIDRGQDVWWLFGIQNWRCSYVIGIATWWCGFSYTSSVFLDI